jgi:SH3 domain protein
VKKQFFVLLALLLALPSAFAQQYFIADKLFTYMHAGPNNTYRIIGSVNAGDKVTFISNNNGTGYTQIQDDRGRKGWVESKFVSQQESMAVRLPRIESELATVKTELEKARNTADQEQAGLISSLEARNTQIAEMEQNYSEISQKLTAAQTEVRNLTAKLDTQKEDLLLKYFMYGGGVAGGGLLLGLILPHVLPRRKKSPNGWA